MWLNESRRSSISRYISSGRSGWRKPVENSKKFEVAADDMQFYINLLGALQMWRKNERQGFHILQHTLVLDKGCMLKAMFMPCSAKHKGSIDTIVRKIQEKAKYDVYLHFSSLCISLLQPVTWIICKGDIHSSQCRSILYIPCFSVAGLHLPTKFYVAHSSPRTTNYTLQPSTYRMVNTEWTGEEREWM